MIHKGMLVDAACTFYRYAWLALSVVALDMWPITNDLIDLSLYYI